MGEPEEIVDTMMSGLTDEEQEMKLDLMEELASLEEIKAMVDQNLEEQSQKTLEAEKLKKKIERNFEDLLEQYNEVSDAGSVDSELGIDEMLKVLKKKVKDGGGKNDEDDTDWKKGKSNRRSKLERFIKKAKAKLHKKHV